MDTARNTTSRAHADAEHTQKRRMVVRRSLMVAAMMVLAAPGLAFAQTAAASGDARAWVGPYAVLVAGFAMAFAAGLCGLGQGRAVAAAVDAMARQPGAAARIQTAMIIGLALIESLAIYVLVVAMILLFVQPIK
jgi:F-type H+-transporting ATPase subunit c